MDVINILKNQLEVKILIKCKKKKAFNINFLSFCFGKYCNLLKKKTK